MAASEFRATLIEWREIAPEVRHFVFEVPGTERLVYTPGQFLTLRAEIRGKTVKRAYSIASAPDGNRFELCLNRVREGEFSPYLFDLGPGAVVDLKGPYGVFRWREPACDAVLIATGTGVAPFRAMLRARLPEDPLHWFTLLFGVRHEEGILYRGEFDETAAAHPNFRFWPTLTRPGTEWRGRTGRVQQHVAEALRNSAGETDVYICGLWDMVRDVRDMLTGMGFDRKRIVFERYD
jgi:CDP-4-dehydro-6-deoxyglucose reductase